MSDGDDWGPWIEHDGGGCPVPVGTWVEVVGVGVNGRLVQDQDWAEVYETWDWTRFGVVDDDGATWGKIINYRVRKPRGLTILESVLSDLPALPDLVPA